MKKKCIIDIKAIVNNLHANTSNLYLYTYRNSGFGTTFVFFNWMRLKFVLNVYKHLDVKVVLVFTRIRCLNNYDNTLQCGQWTIFLRFPVKTVENRKRSLQHRVYETKTSRTESFLTSFKIQYKSTDVKIIVIKIN